GRSRKARLAEEQHGRDQVAHHERRLVGRDESPNLSERLLGEGNRGEKNQRGHRHGDEGKPTVGGGSGAGADEIVVCERRGQRPLPPRRDCRILEPGLLHGVGQGFHYISTISCSNVRLLLTSCKYSLAIR